VPPISLIFEYAERSRDLHRSASRFAGPVFLTFSAPAELRPCNVMLSSE
jgi:hypothetical protein